MPEHKLLHRIQIGVAPAPPTISYWLLENGDRVNIENSDKAQLENT